MAAPLWIYRVAGQSMYPTFSAGDTVIGLKWFRPRVGDVVVLKQPDRLMLKRIIRAYGGKYWVEGDNKAASTDSRQFGAVPRSALEARIVAKL